MATQTAVKTQKEIEDLINDWKSDPCWDIEDTTGFEAHYQELHEWRHDYEQIQAIKEDNRLTEKAKTLGCSVELVGYIEALERRIARLEATS